MTPPPDVVAAAQAAQKKWGIPASVSLAQWAQESGWGKHCPANNPFGIKAAHGQPMVLLTTHEFIAGRYVTIKAPFRAFSSLAEAFDVHAELLATSHHYAAARALLPGPFAFAHALTGVYATDPLYGNELAAIMNGGNLTQYDA